MRLWRLAIVLGLGAAPSFWTASIGRAISKPAPAAAAPTALSGRPLYFERTVTEEDLEGRSAAELRLMRNTLFARKGRAFEDPQLREYFSRLPWYRPRQQQNGVERAGAKDGGGRESKGADKADAVDLSEVDRKNLTAIRIYETVASGVEGLHRLVPGFDERAAPRTLAGVDCGTDARHRLRDKRDARRLLRAGARLPWSQIRNYEEAGWTEHQLISKAKVSEVVCGPDLDGDGALEAVVTLSCSFDVEQSPESSDQPESLELIFLASRKGADWRAVTPLGLGGSFASIGIEGSVGTAVAFVTLADGRRALAVKDMFGGGGDCDCGGAVVSVSTLASGKLASLGQFEVGTPCPCQWGGE